MKKIISLFQRNYDTDRMARDELVPGAEWAAAGEGIATIKWDGTSCMVRGGVLFRRYDAKHGKAPPPNFEPAQDPDPVTGHWPGWIPVGAGPSDRWHREAARTGLLDGTYELIGPRVQSNPHRLTEHRLVPHGHHAIVDAPRTFEGLREYLGRMEIEGIVWHHPDGRMVKVKRKDFGLPWPVKREGER